MNILKINLATIILICVSSTLVATNDDVNSQTIGLLTKQFLNSIQEYLHLTAIVCWNLGR